MKHLYLMLVPFYFFFLLGRHCSVVVVVVMAGEWKDGKRAKGYDRDNDEDNDETTSVSVQFLWGRFLVLAGMSLICILGPFVPFLMQPDPVGQMRQILRRLFPFGRGVRTASIHSHLS